MWITGFLGGEVVCNKCIKNNKDFLYKQQHFNDALTIQVYWRLHKGIKPQYFELWKGREKRKCETMTFQPISIPDNLQENEHIKVFRMLFDKGYLIEWDIGVRNGHISSRWVGYWGKVDILTSRSPDDINYSKLLEAHLCLFFEKVPRWRG